jgi:hypothetical protein
LGGGCSVYVRPDLVFALPISAAGTANQPVAIPANPALMGTNLYCQWLVVDSAAPSSVGMAVTNAGALQL